MEDNRLRKLGSKAVRFRREKQPGRDQEGTAEVQDRVTRSLGTRSSIEESSQESSRQVHTVKESGEQEDLLRTSYSVPG
jgi:hypothetical protein